MAVVAMGSTTNMHNTRAQTSLRAAMGFSMEETMKPFLGHWRSVLKGDDVFQWRKAGGFI